MVRWPAVVAPGTWTDAVGHIIDFQPTFMQLAGLDPVADVPAGKHPLDGEVILPIFEGRDFARMKPLFFEWNGSRAVRDGDWKVVYDGGDDDWALFNMAEDRSELHDLSAQHPERKQAMVAAWSAWAEAYGVSLKRKKR